MKTSKSMLTYEILEQFEREKDSDRFTPEICEIAQHAAYVAMVNRHENERRHAGVWTKEDIYDDFIRVMAIHGIAYGNIPYNRHQ